MNPSDAAAIERELHGLAPTFLADVGAQLSRRAFGLGLAVTDVRSGQAKPIPVVGTPVVIAPSDGKNRQRLAHRLAGAGARLAEALLASGDAGQFLGGFSPLEQQYARQGHPAGLLATTRVDFFQGDALKALELNATIPAMQGYSDMAAQAWIETVGHHAGLSPGRIAQLVLDNGSNARALLEALQAGFERLRPGRPLRRMVLLCRRNDAQLTEQRYLAGVFESLGVEAHVVYPDALSGETEVSFRGAPVDLVYRHLFVRRLESPELADADYVRWLLGKPAGMRTVVLNPPASQVEAKAVFARLSEALGDGAWAQRAGLSAEECEALREVVPWTRVFRGDALLAEVREQPDRFVLKRSWDYGGKTVFVGRSRFQPGFAERTAEAFGQPLEWSEVCQRAAADTAGGGFVVQEYVEAHPQPHLVCGERVEARELYVDYSAYASVGLEGIPWGGVCRGSVSPIVNIVGGGGVLPLLDGRVAATLCEALRTRYSNE